MMRFSRIRRGHPAGWSLVAFACLVAGYADLWRGGTSTAAVLLVIGYLVLVPLAIAAWFGSVPVGVRYVGRVSDDHASSKDRPTYLTPNGRGDEAPPYRIAAIVSTVVLALYVVTLAPSTAMWDTSEYIAVARVLGLPHPPGNPLFVLIAHAFALLPIPVSYAERVNLLAAVTSALSAGLWFLVAHRSMRGSGLPRIPRLLGAACAAWIGATAFSVWNQSVVNEKVYTLALLGVALVSWIALRWFDAPVAARRSDMFLVLAAYLCGLGYANHPAGFLPLPAFGLFVLLRRPTTLLRWRALAAAAFALVIGLTPFAFEPIRSSHNPAINEGMPTACETGPRVDCMLSAVTWQRLKANINREQYGGHAVARRQTALPAQFGMWWMYFEWQWWRDAFQAHPAWQRALSMLFLSLALIGAVAHWRHDRDSFLFVAPLIATLTPALVFYLNFKYGWSQDIELGDSVPREVRDRDYFFVWSFATLAIWMGMGLAQLWRWTAEPLRARVPRAWLATSPLLLVAWIPFAGNHEQASRRGHEFTRAWARDLLSSVEPYAILITNGDNDSFPLWYAQEVEGIRRDVSVVLTPYLGTDWYVRQLLRARVAPYDGTGLPVFAATASQRPTGSMMALTSAEADAIPQYVELRETQEFRHGAIRATIQPGVLTRDQLLVLRLIADSFATRPVYFSLGRYPHAIGLGEHVVSHGLAQQLVNLSLIHI